MATPHASPPHLSPPSWARDAVAELAHRDPDFARIEAIAGPLAWHRRPRGFPGLLRAICGQWISNEAAAAVFRRLSALPGATEPLGLLALSTDALCGTGGLSRQKAAHARALAEACLDGTLRLGDLDTMPEDEAVRHLCQVRGLGPWTAEVHLLLGHDRPDVFPAGDLAVAAGLAHLKGLPERPQPRPLRATAEAWRPWRSVAARLLWHHWLHATGRAVEDRG
jgi:DNA-3-methyladenine glycosylase II